MKRGAGAPGVGHGGRHERYKLFRSDSAGSREPPGPPASHLGEHLLKQWAWGELSANAVQQLASAAYEDQKSLLRSIGASEDMAHPTLRHLARLGNSGKTPGNVLQQLLTFLGEPSAPPFLVHSIPVHVSKPRGVGAEDRNAASVPCNTPFLLPHEAFAWYYNNDPERFRRLFLGVCCSGEDRRRFWRTLVERGDPRLHGHPMRRRREWMSNAVPLALHGDGVPVLQTGKAGAKSFEVLSIQSLWASGPTVSIKLYVFGMWAGASSDDTWKEVWRVLVWSLHWLYEGRWPPVDWDGAAWTDAHPEYKANANKPLANGLFCPLYALKGDLEYYSNFLKLRHFNSNQLCDLCPATRCEDDRTLLYNNFSPDARWQTMLYDSATWRAEYTGRFVHWVFSVVGVSNLSIEPDELHILHLGVSQYLIGSVLYSLVYEAMAGTPGDNMKLIWDLVTGHYSANAVETQYTSLSLTSFCNPSSPESKYPCLKGKGAEVKDLLPAIREIWHAYGQQHDHYGLIDRTVSELEGLQNILRAHGNDMFLPVPAAEQLKRHATTFLVSYQELAFLAESAGKLLWNNPAKFHWLWHLADKARFLNPRRTNTFVDEDFVGRVKVLVHSCSAGTSLQGMVCKFADKYSWVLHFLSVARVATV